jgi:hypothetical protein
VRAARVARSVGMRRVARTRAIGRNNEAVTRTASCELRSSIVAMEAPLSFAAREE